METAALYGMSHQHGVKALSMMTITDEIILQGYDPVLQKFANPKNKYAFNGMSSEIRETKLDCMALLGLYTAVRFVKGKSN